MVVGRRFIMGSCRLGSAYTRSQRSRREGAHQSRPVGTSRSEHEPRLTVVVWCPERDKQHGPLRERWLNAVMSVHIGPIGSKLHMRRLCMPLVCHGEVRALGMIVCYDAEYSS
eukprot:SAG31_NODE_6441_length_2017_cov_1.540146_4_plen_113_part_00